MNIELPLEGLTWGELRAFVALSDHDDEHEVLFDHDRGGAIQSIFITGLNPRTITRTEE